jgi:hypothetical protein
MKHTKPTMSWAVNKAHLNELLAKYWQREYEEAIDWLATLDKITMEIRDDAEDALDGCLDDRSASVMIETIERVRTAMGVKQLW